jgi:hypothetical protein
MEQYVDHGRGIEKRQMSNRNFVTAAAVLSGQWGVDREGAWGLGIMPRHDQDWTDVGSQSKIGHPDLNMVWLSSRVSSTSCTAAREGSRSTTAAS